MLHLSNAFRQKLYFDERNYLVWADIILPNKTELNLTTREIWSGGFIIDDAVSGDSSFEALGSAVCNSATLIINNQDERYMQYDFTHAEVTLYVGMQLKNGSSTRTEKIKKGTYIVDSATYSDGLITLYCLDFMQYFDVAYETNLVFPATLDRIVRDACNLCDISLKTTNFPHKNFIVQEKPDGDNTTFRDVICWAAQIAGCFARMNVDGKLELKWFDQASMEIDGWDGGSFDKTTRSSYQTGDRLDGGTLEPWTEGDTADSGTFESDDAQIHQINALSSQTMSVDDVIITGIKTVIDVQKKNEDIPEDDLTTSEYSEPNTKTMEAGTTGYRIEISGNKFLTEENAQEVTDWLGDQLIGLRFRQANVSHGSDPSIEAGDIAMVWDRKGRNFPILVTRTNFSVGKTQQTISAAETPGRNSAVQYDQRTKAFVDARKLIKRELSERERAMDNLAKALAAHSGLYKTEEVQEDGSTIFYLHDMPAWQDSAVIWKMTKDAVGVSTDGGKTWNAGLTAEGDAILQRIYAIGLDADYITTGSIIGQAKDKSGNRTGPVIFSMDVDTGEVYFAADKFTLKPSGSSADSTKQTIKDYVEGKAEDAVDAQTQSDIFNKLTNNGTLQGIYMENQKLYVNASYIKTGAINADLITTGSMNAARITAGVLQDSNGNVKFDLTNGTLSMTAGSINLGSGNFKVTSGGSLTAVDATISGQFTCGSYGSGYWARMDSNGRLAGGYGDTQYGYISYAASTSMIDTGEVRNGMQFQSTSIIRISSPWIAIAESSNVSTTATVCGSGTMNYIKQIVNNGDGSITWYSGSITFKNGLMCTSL